jgi:hypothetical protein
VNARDERHELREEEILAIREMEEVAKMLGSGRWPGLAEWQRLSHLPPPKIDGSHIWTGPETRAER